METLEELTNGWLVMKFQQLTTHLHPLRQWKRQERRHLTLEERYLWRGWLALWVPSIYALKGRDVDSLSPQTFLQGESQMCPLWRFRKQWRRWLCLRSNHIFINGGQMCKFLPDQIWTMWERRQAWRYLRESPGEDRNPSLKEWRKVATKCHNFTGRVTFLWVKGAVVKIFSRLFSKEPTKDPREKRLSFRYVQRRQMATRIDMFSKIFAGPIYPPASTSHSKSGGRTKGASYKEKVMPMPALPSAGFLTG